MSTESYQVNPESQEDTECNTIITSDGSCVDALTFNIYNFVACMQTEGLDFYQAYLNELGEPRFYYYEKQDIDGLLILKEAWCCVIVIRHVVADCDAKP